MDFFSMVQSMLLCKGASCHFDHPVFVFWFAIFFSIFCHSSNFYCKTKLIWYPSCKGILFLMDFDLFFYDID